MSDVRRKLRISRSEIAARVTDNNRVAVYDEKDMLQLELADAKRLVKFLARAVEYIESRKRSAK